MVCILGNHTSTISLILNSLLLLLALMALSFSSVTLPSSKFPTNSVSNHVFQKSLIITKCEQTNDSSELSADQNSTLKIGSAIIVVDAPKTIKTAASISCLKVNADLVKTGDVGRIVARKPKDVWAVQLAIGTYLIDGKHFRPLDLDQQ
ncbi:hypothetical protein IFM89_027461 [Coptis chinensis]|uniref:Chlororespiratory reduction 42 n=1 Tax=Coptis chinensis TaxID=261450 RepID=A0A835IVE6_9MAGN|nr:hypothetical protein IFM89_027461 [Coptis chinensis]